jgi:hypothetical protein
MPTAKFKCSLLNRLLKPRPVRLELTQIEAKRKNFKPIDDRPRRIVVSPSGDMAYEYGTRDGNWDDAASGKHVSLHASYLRVWTVNEGRCLVAGAARPAIDQSGMSVGACMLRRKN